MLSSLNFPCFPPPPCEYLQASCEIVYQIFIGIRFKAGWREQRAPSAPGKQGAIQRDKIQKGEGTTLGQINVLS